MLMSTLLPYSPPSPHTMDPEQRTRLLRTARKLEAILGTTPQFIGSNDQFRRGPTTKARKRNDVYVSQFSSSASSLESSSSETQKERARTRPDVRDVFMARGSSSPTKVLNDEKKTKRSMGARQPLAQPLLLRMSAVPVGHHRRVSSSSITMPTKHAIPAPPLLTPFERRKLKVDSVLGPLSPVNIYHFPAHPYSHSRSHSDLGPPSPSASAPDVQDAPPTGLSDREKRIKMAKLQRIMGENVPQELVFRETSPATETTGKKLRRRSRSMSAIRTGTSTVSSPIFESPVDIKGKGKETEVVRPPRPLPTVPISNTAPRSLPPTPPPAPMITQTITTTTSGPLVRQLSLSMKQKSRKSRPKSLTLGTASAFVAANIRLARQEKEMVETAERVRGTVSLDEDRHLLKRRDTAKESSYNGPIIERPDAPFVARKEEIPNLAVFKTEIWRRKEREWSGEWNIKDMEEVTKALRGLRTT